MRFLLSAPAVIAISVGLVAQNSPSSPDKASEPSASLSVVAGRVVTAAAGNPLKSARVALVPEHFGSRGQIYATTSDVDGHFLLKAVPPGSYQFFADRAGFVEQRYKAGDDGTGAILSLKAGQKISDVLFRLTVAAVIAGRVSNEDGEAIARAQVFALRQRSEEEIEDEGVSRSRERELQAVASAQTDDRGQYRIFGLKPGKYYIRVSNYYEATHDIPVDDSFWVQQFLGSEYPALYYPGVARARQAQAISVKPGGEGLADVVMRPAKTAEVTGHVVGPNGPAADASVTLAPLEENDFGLYRQDTTDEKGNFRLEHIPEGSYLILVSEGGNGDQFYQTRASQKLEVSGDNINSLTISLSGGTTIRGHVTVSGPSSVMARAEVQLIAIEDDDSFGGEGRVKKDGTFEIPFVHDGDYAVSIWGLDEKQYVKSVRLGPDDVLEKGLQVAGDRSDGRIEVVVGSDGPQLEGIVSDDDGVVIGAHVRVAPEPETPYNRFRSQRTTTDQLGHFAVRGLAPGKYRVLARSSKNTSYKSEPQTLTLSEKDHKAIQVKLVRPDE
jgi:hypothetical protein